MLKRVTPLARWTIGLSIPVGLISFLPTASYAYAELAGYRFTWLVWLSGLIYRTAADQLLYAGLIGGATAIAIPAFTAFILLPPKPLHGSARLARPGEIAALRLLVRNRKARKQVGALNGGEKGRNPNPLSAGIVLGRYRGRLLVYDRDKHPFLAAPTGSGKGVGFVVPNLLYWPGSTIMLDIKGENYAITSGWRAQALGQPVYRFDPLHREGRTHAFNPLAYVTDGDGRISDLQTIAAILVPNEDKDPYWENAARDLLLGLLLLVIEAGPHRGWPVTIGQVARLMRTDDELGAYLETLLDELADDGVALSSVCRGYLRSFCNEPEKPRGSIKSTLATRLSLWANPLVDRATACNHFDLRRIRREPMSIYLAISPDDLTRLNPLLRLFIEFFLSTNTRAGETPAQDPSLNVPVLLLLDEFLALGRVNRLVQALSYVRGWGIKIATVIQSEAQLHAVYGRDMAEFYIDNHGARVYYRPPLHRRDSAEQLSRVVGQRTVRQTSVSAGHGTRSRQVSKTGQAVLDPDEIAHLPERDILVLVDGIRPFLARKLCYFTDRLFRPRAAMGALALPAPLTGELPDAPTLRSEPNANDALGAGSDTAEPVEHAIERASPDPAHDEPAVDVSALIARVRAMNPAPDDPAIAEVADQFVRASPALRAA